MISFVPVIDQIHLLPKDAIRYIESALENTPGGIMTLNDVIAGVVEKHGSLFLIEEDGIIGITYLEVNYIKSEPILNIALLSGKDIRKWRREYYDFIQAICLSAGISRILIIGREGWDRLMPDFPSKRIGIIYEVSLI